MVSEENYSCFRAVLNIYYCIDFISVTLLFLTWYDLKKKKFSNFCVKKINGLGENHLYYLKWRFDSLLLLFKLHH